MLKKIAQNISKQREAQRRAELYRNLMRHEARIGGKLFGAVPKGHRREFFCLDEHSWVWHEEWIDSTGKRNSLTTRYDVRPDGIFKVFNGQYSPISKTEKYRFIDAVKLYQQKVNTQLYANVI